MANVGDKDTSNVDMLTSTDYIADTEGQDRNIDIDNGIDVNDALSLSEMTTNTEDSTPTHPTPSPGDIRHETVNNGKGEGGKEEENMKTETEEKVSVKEDDYEKAYEHVYKVYQKSNFKVTNKQGTWVRKQEQEYRFNSSSKKNMGLMEGGEENSRQWDVLWKVLRISSVVLNGMVVIWWVYPYLS